MARLKLKSSQIYYEFPEDKLKPVLEIWQDGGRNYNTPITLEYLHFTKGKIDMIEMNPPQKEDKFGKLAIEWNEYWERQILKSPQEKAADSLRALFLSWWSIYTGKVYNNLDEFENQDLLKEAHNRTIQWFAENSQRTVPDYEIWKDLFPEPVQTGDVWKDSVRMGMLPVLTSVLATDLRRTNYQDDKEKKIESIGIKSKTDILENIPF